MKFRIMYFMTKWEYISVRQWERKREKKNNQCVSVEFKRIYNLNLYIGSCVFAYMYMRENWLIINISVIFKLNVYISVLITMNVITRGKMFYLNFKYRIERILSTFEITLINLQANVDAWGGYSVYNGVHKVKAA